MNNQKKTAAILILGALLALASCNNDDRNIMLLPVGVRAVPVSQRGQLPTVTTAAIAGNLTFTATIAGISATGGGTVTDQGASAVTERGLCWNTTGSPTIDDLKASDGSGTGVFENAWMTGLMLRTIYYVRAYATNSEGTAYGNPVMFNSGQRYGSIHEGGYVFYNDGYGGGLVCALSDQSTSQVWIEGGSTQTTLNGNTSTAIGTGLANSNAIVAQSGHTGSAAKVCLDYSDGTYSDWYLPSLDELYLMDMKLKRNGVGDFSSDIYLDSYYWSSSEYSTADAASDHNFNSGYNAALLKFYAIRVRAVRAF